jgi:lysophospholipase L1-like esterase
VPWNPRKRCDAQSRQRKEQVRLKVFVIGDSISIQYGPYLERFLHGMMEYARKEGELEALRNLDQPIGANGGDSQKVLEFLSAMATRGGIVADVLLLNCGLHDIKCDIHTGTKQIPLDRYQDNLRKIIQVASGMRPAPVWIRTTPCDEKVHNKPGLPFYRYAADVEAYNAAADRIMAEAGIPVIDLYTFTLNMGPDLYIDHVHFFEPIREKQAAFLAGWLMAWLSSRGRVTQTHFGA